MAARRRWSTALAAALIAAAACSPDAGAPSSGPTPSPAATETSAPEGKFIFYLLGKQLLRFNIETSFSLIVGDLPSDQVAVSPVGRRAVFVQESHFKGMKGPQFREPIIRIGPARPGLYRQAQTLGAGQMPVWSPLDGHTVAAMDLDGDPVAYDAARAPGQEGEPLDPVPRWARFAWDPERTVGEIFPTVDFDTGRVVQGALAPDGNAVAAIVADEAATEAVIIDVPDGTVTEIPKSDGAVQILWGPDGQSFVYVRLVKGNRRHVILCRAADDCRDVFFWKSPVRLVALTP